MKTLYGIISGILLIAIAIGAYIGICKNDTRTKRITRLTNLFSSICSGVRRYTVDLFKGNGPIAVEDGTIPVEG